jgi:hypothetical protein
LDPSFRKVIHDMYKQDPEKFINSFMDGLNEANRRQKAYLEELNKEKLPVFFCPLLCQWGG